MIERLGLEEVVKIHPFSDDLEQEFLDSSMFLMSSLYEGFGLVLIEAMSCGLPCIALNCPYGPGEIIHNDETERMAPDGHELWDMATAIHRLIINHPLRRQLGKEAKENSKRFLADKVMIKWIDLFNRLTAQ